MIDKVRKFVLQRLQDKNLDACSDDDPIVSSGMISSVDMLEILLDLENEGLNVVQVPLEEVDSISDIVKYI